MIGLAVAGRPRDNPLGVVERVFSPREPKRGFLRNGEYGVRGAVDLEILYDPPGHVRLPVNDDEVIDRTLAAKPLAGNQSR